LEHNQGGQAIPLLQESLRHNPSDSFAHWYLSEAYRYGGALEDSLAGGLALKLNPNVSENLTLNTYLYVGQYNKFLVASCGPGIVRGPFSIADSLISIFRMPEKRRENSTGPSR
jgi:hypothetical protein